jgi:hypothetical protein
MKSLNQLRDEIHANAKEKGFCDSKKEVGTMLMLIVSELAEALEADRTGDFCDFSKYEKCKKEMDVGIRTSEEIEKYAFEKYIKNTFEDELADVIIRTLSICGYLGIDIERNILAKMKYNKTREKMHSKKY